MKQNTLLALLVLICIGAYSQIPPIPVTPSTTPASSPAPSASTAVAWTQVSPDVKTMSAYSFQGSTFNLFAVKITSATLRKFDIMENSSNLKHQDFLAKINKDSSFIINAAVSDQNGKPMGYYVKATRQVQDVNLQSGPGNFYLKPNGALLLTDADAIICESSLIKKQVDVNLGIQPGPMLISNGAINPGFNQGSTNLNLRCGVGIFLENSDKYLVFCMSNKVVNFYTFATLFQSLNCTNALSLDNAGVAMYFPNEIDPNSGFNSIIHNYIVYKY
jgi:uncharacterized protein YigE (DUF2233 family)